MNFQWSEVMTSTSPGSPNESNGNQNEKVPVGVEAVGSLARRRILDTDPRSISDDVTRTPIQVEKAKNDESTPRAAPPILDPRSPSTAMPRTPLSLTAGKVSFDEAIETAEAEHKPPTRGTTVAAELREIERQIEDVVKVQDESYEKEEGEITHDSDDDENEENENRRCAIGITPITKRTKSMLESDCRSPLLIENETANAIAETSFDRALAFELGNMAAKGMVVNRKILGDKSNTTKQSTSPSNDSLVI